MLENSQLILPLFAGLTLAGAMPAQNQLYTVYGDSAWDGLGWSVAGAGDVNRDGYDDVIVGSTNLTGSARVLSGRYGSILYTFYGDSVGDFFGVSVDGAGDVNRDGYADLVVGASRDDDKGDRSGSARVFSGKDGAILYTFHGNSADEDFGQSVAGAGDFNRDGYDDIIVGAPLDDDNGTNSGTAWVWSGKNGSLLYKASGAAAGDVLGRSVAGAGDVNQDGHDDVIVGTNSNDETGSRTGSAMVLSGADHTVLYIFYGDSVSDFFGTCVAGAGDVDQDGFDDVIVGAPGDDDNGSRSGSATVLSGRNGSVLYAFYGNATDDALGHSVDGAGDVDRDGHPDLIVGVSTYDTAVAGTRVHSGADGSILYTFYGDAVDDEFGWSVSGAGDVNGDGFADLIVGAWADDDNGFQSGSAQVLSGLGGSSHTGKSCTIAPCESCPRMLATTSGGIPKPNNSKFALTLVNAPSNLQYAILAISGSPCVSPGTPLIFCDTLKLPAPLLYARAVPFTPGGANCMTNVTFPLPIPNDPNLVGIALGAQWAVSCDVENPLSTSISNCVSFVVSN